MNDPDLLSAILEKYGGEAVIGEEATDYTKRPFRTVRFDFIKTHNPNMKFVFIVRDPIQKLFSQYRHFRRHQPQKTLETLREEVSSYAYYKYGSAFCFQLQPYVANFGKDAIHIVLLEELMTEPQNELNRIFEFLGLSSCALSEAALVKHNVNNEISKSSCSIDYIPQEVLEFVLNDAHRFSQFLGRDLGFIWPSISRRHDSNFVSSSQKAGRCS